MVRTINQRQAWALVFVLFSGFFWCSSAPAFAQDGNPDTVVEYGDGGGVEIQTDACNTYFRGGMLITCANAPLNQGGGNGNSGDIVIGTAPGASPAALRMIPAFGGPNIPVLRTSRDGVTNLGQPAVWLLPPNWSLVLNPGTAGLITIGTSGATALFQVDCRNGVIQMAIPDLAGMFGVGRGSAPISLYWEGHPTVLSCVITNTSSVDRKIGVNNLGGG